MGFQVVNLNITLTKDEFVSLLLLKGSVETEATDALVGSPEKVKVVLNGSDQHMKYGQPGVEDGSNHFFWTYLAYKAQIVRARVSLQSQDGGEIYEGAIGFTLNPGDNLSE